jgi:hypothetical protein
MPLPLPPSDYNTSPAWSSPLPPTRHKSLDNLHGKPKLITPPKKSYEGDDPVPLSGVAEINGKGIYFLKIAMGDTGYSGFSQFVHETRFTAEEFKAMVDEAVAITNTIRIKRRREQLERNRVPITNPVETNESYFATDIQFFEGVMCDKWDFRILVTSGLETAIEATIPGVK